MWANGRLIEFRTGKRFRTRVYQLHKSVNDRESLKLATEMGWKKLNTNFRVWNIPTGQTELPFQTFRFFRKFSIRTTRKIVFHLLSNRIFQKLFLNGKQAVGPKFPIGIIYPNGKLCSICFFLSVTF